MSWPFLFVGAGEATYFEWAEVHVFFERAPTEREKEAIEADVPPPIADAIEWDGVHLMAASDRYANLAIDETYATPEDEEEESVARFNTAIEAWLRSAHRICPILVAYRHEDEQSGGTDFSDWHRWSAQQTDRLLPVLEPILEEESDDAKSHAARGILNMLLESGVFLPKRVQHLLDPSAAIRAALDAGDSRALIRQLETKEQAIELLEAELSLRHPKHVSALLGAGEAIVDRDDVSDEITIALARAASSAEAKKVPPSDVRRALDHVRSRASESKPIADMLAYQAFQAIQSGEWREAIELFELVLDSPDLELTAYNNALYAIMSDNNKLPIDRARAERFLRAALRFGPENPSIFYNSACVYMELGESEKVIECLALAREHGYQNVEKMRDEPMFRPLASDPRFIAVFADL